VHKYFNIKIIIAASFILSYSLLYVDLNASAQSNSLGSPSQFTITINPGATDSSSQNPVSPKDITIPYGTTIIWVNKDSSPHMIASGTPNSGPSNIFYSNYFDNDKSYNVTLNNPGTYGYYDPGSPNVSGHITVISGSNLPSQNTLQIQQTPGRNNNLNNNTSSFSIPSSSQQQLSKNNNLLSQSGDGSITNNNAPLSSPSTPQQQQQATGSANIINNNNPTAQSNSPIGNNFIISGPLSSFLSTPSGNWVVNGSWALKVQNGNLSFFRGFMQWDPTNITKLPHTHSFVNFRAYPNSQSRISLGPDRVVDIKGIMDIGANNKIEWIDVPAEIKTAGNTITVSILDDAKTGNHFNNYPVFGKISGIEKCSDNGGFGANMEFDPTVAKCSI
jgi:plastocyanin